MDPADEGTFLADLIEFTEDDPRAFTEFMHIRGWSEEECDEMRKKIYKRVGRS